MSSTSPAKKQRDMRKKMSDQNAAFSLNSQLKTHSNLPYD